MWTLRGTAIVLFFLWLFLDGAVVFRRKTGKAENRDRFSLWLILIGNAVAWVVGIYLAYRPFGLMQPVVPTQITGFFVMGVGIGVRSMAIAQLGRFHTPNVAVLDGHEVVDAGLYHHIRHPSYLGALLALLGFSLALANWLSLAIIMGVSIPVYLYRIREEEAALMAAFGSGYHAYCQRTKRLVPGIY